MPAHIAYTAPQRLRQCLFCGKDTGGAFKGSIDIFPLIWSKDTRKKPFPDPRLEFPEAFYLYQIPEPALAMTSFSGCRYF
jgi:hypothetical protein